MTYSAASRSRSTKRVTARSGRAQAGARPAPAGGRRAGSAPRLVELRQARWPSLASSSKPPGGSRRHRRPGGGPRRRAGQPAAARRPRAARSASASCSPSRTAAPASILRRLAHAARWDPQLALELSGSLIYLVPARPELGAKIHETSIILHRALPPFADPQAAARVPAAAGRPPDRRQGGRPKRRAAARPLLPQVPAGARARVSLLARWWRWPPPRRGAGGRRAGRGARRQLSARAARQGGGASGRPLPAARPDLRGTALLEREVVQPVFAGTPEKRSWPPGWPPAAPAATFGGNLRRLAGPFPRCRSWRWPSRRRSTIRGSPAKTTTRCSAGTGCRPNG